MPWHRSTPERHVIKWLITRWHNNAQVRLVNFVRSRYSLIKVEPKQGLFNYKCYFNAVQYTMEHAGVQVVEVIYVDQGAPILHYLNHDPETGVYLETTQGFRAEYFEYYLLRTIHPDDYKFIGGEFDRAVLSWTEQFTTRFQRWLGVERIL